jgi:hypothetical protein
VRCLPYRVMSGHGLRAQIVPAKRGRTGAADRRRASHRHRLPVFRHVASPGTAELQALVPNIAERIGRPLEKRGLIERDCENAWLSGDMAPAGSLDDGLTVYESGPIGVLVNLRLSFARSHARRKSWIGWTLGRF